MNSNLVSNHLVYYVYKSFRLAPPSTSSSTDSIPDAADSSDGAPRNPLPKRSRSVNHRNRSTSDPYRPGSLGRRKTISPSASLQDLSSASHSERERMIFNSLAQKLPFPDWNFSLSPPMQIPSSKDADDFYTRAISVFNRIPVVDLHKIGVVYVGPGQTSESDILSNESGSPAYEKFLASLGMCLLYFNNLTTRQLCESKRMS